MKTRIPFQTLVKNIRIIANVDNDRFHVLIGKSHQMHVKND